MRVSYDLFPLSQECNCQRSRPSLPRLSKHASVATAYLNFGIHVQFFVEYFSLRFLHLAIGSISALWPPAFIRYSLSQLVGSRAFIAKYLRYESRIDHKLQCNACADKCSLGIVRPTTTRGAKSIRYQLQARVSSLAPLLATAMATFSQKLVRACLIQLSSAVDPRMNSATSSRNPSSQAKATFRQRLLQAGKPLSRPSRRQARPAQTAQAIRWTGTRSDQSRHLSAVSLFVTRQQQHAHSTVRKQYQRILSRLLRVRQRFGKASRPHFRGQRQAARLQALAKRPRLRSRSTSIRSRRANSKKSPW